jgi:dTDP-4-amino-4,6-dideoxygalactose transaminase
MPADYRDFYRGRRGLVTGGCRRVNPSVKVPAQPAAAAERPATCPVADRVCDEVFSLPLHPGMTRQAIEEVAAAVQAFHAPA